MTSAMSEEDKGKLLGLNALNFFGISKNRWTNASKK